MSVSMRFGGVSAAALLAGGGGDPTPAVSTNYGTLTNVQPVAGWGTIKRNPDYSGPLLRLRNAVTAAETDVSADADGFVNSNPYGADARVIRLYDQWGTEDLTHRDPPNSDILLAKDAEDKGYHVQSGSSNSRLVSASTVADNPAWKLDHPFWLIVAERATSLGLKTLAKVPALGTGYMVAGVWSENESWHWRVNGGGGSDWPETDRNKYDNMNGHWETLFLDYTQRDGGARGYVHNYLCPNYSYTTPLNYNDSTAKLEVLDGNTGSNFLGKFVELAIFDSTAGASVADRASLAIAARDISPDEATGFDAVVFLQGFDGADGDKPATDEGPDARPITYFGSCQVDTSQSKIGTGSLRVSSDNAHFPMPARPMFDDFTIELWVRFNTLSGWQGIVGDFYAPFENSWNLWVRGDTNAFGFVVYDRFLLDSAVVPVTNTWYHLAAVREGDMGFLYVDGVSEVSSDGFASIPVFSRDTAVQRLGRNRFGDSMDGWIDELRITREAIYPGGTTFTPPTAKFPRA